MARQRACRAQLALLLACALAFVASSTEEQRRGGRQLLGASDHKFKPSEEVILYANKVGPYSNPRSAAGAACRLLPRATTVRNPRVGRWRRARWGRALVPRALAAPRC